METEMNNPNGARAASALGETMARIQVQDERPWDSLSIEERIERLRRALLAVSSDVGYSGRASTEALNIAKAHQHNERGMVLMPIFQETVFAGRGEYSDHVIERAKKLLR
jgi:hypothetical protein